MPFQWLIKKRDASLHCNLLTVKCKGRYGIIEILMLRTNGATQKKMLHYVFLISGCNRRKKSVCSLFSEMFANNLIILYLTHCSVGFIS